MDEQSRAIELRLSQIELVLIGLVNAAGATVAVAEQLQVWRDRLIQGGIEEPPAAFTLLDALKAPPDA